MTNRLGIRRKAVRAAKKRPQKTQSKGMSWAIYATRSQGRTINTKNPHRLSTLMRLHRLARQMQRP